MADQTGRESEDFSEDVTAFSRGSLAWVFSQTIASGRWSVRACYPGGCHRNSALLSMKAGEGGRIPIRLWWFSMCLANRFWMASDKGWRRQRFWQLTVLAAAIVLTGCSQGVEQLVDRVAALTDQH